MKLHSRLIHAPAILKSRIKRRRAVVAAMLLLASSLPALAQPVITGIYPPTLTERAGDHVAFVVSASGTGPLAYQWYQNNVPLPGQTNASIVLTNIQAGNGGLYGVTVTDSSENPASNSATLIVATNYLPLYPTNLVVLRLGDGVQVLSGAAGNTIYLDQYAANGAYVSTLQIPDNLPGKSYGAGTNKSIAGSTSVILPGAGIDAINQGVLTLSGNQQWITFGGYQVAYPYTGADVTAGGANNVRGIYLVNAYGYPFLAYTNYGLYNGGAHTLRSVFTTDGTNFWTTGQAGSVSGVKYVNKTVASYAAGSGVPNIVGTTNGPRVIQVIDGNLDYSDAASSPHGLWHFSGLPEPASSGTSAAPALGLNEGGLPNDFAVSPDENTVYIADGQAYGGNAVPAGGIQRWDWNDSTGYTYSYTLPIVGTNGAQNLAVNFPSTIGSWGPGVTGAILYATPAVATNATSDSIISVVDNGPASIATVIVTTGPNEVLRGLRFGPSVIAPLSIVSQPQSQTVPVDNQATFTVTAQGAPPFSYQWQFGGTNLVGAPSASLTLTNIQFAAAGNYSVIVSDLKTSVTSSVAVLSVALGPPVITANPNSRIETIGDHLALAVGAAGSLPISYQWFYNTTPIPGATNSALVLTNVQPGESGSYYAAITNIYGSTNSTVATLTVTTGPQYLFPTNLIVARVGDGSQTLSLATGNTLYLDQYGANGTYLGSIQIPDQGLGLPYGYGTGANASSSAGLPPGSDPLILAGAGSDAPYEGLLTVSADQAAVNFAGYVQAYPFNGSDVTYTGQTSAGNSTNQWRGIGAVSAYGNYTLVDTNSGLFSGGNHTIHSAVTPEGVNFWVAGQAQNDGIKYINTTVASYANGVGVPQIVSSGPGPRSVQLINSNLIFSDAGAAPPGLYASAGLPEPAKNGALTSSLLINEGGSPVDFAFSPDGQTVYISDDELFAGNNVPAGGIQRWDSNGSGGYNYSYTLAAGNGVGAIGLTAYFPPSITTWGAGVTGASLFATTAERPNNRLVSVTDNGADSTAVTLQTSGVNQAFSGIRFGPSPVAPGIYTNPQPVTAFAGQSATLSAVLTGSTPFTYQWQQNGTNVTGATNAILTLNGIQNITAGLYSLVVSNPAGSITSAPAALTVLTLPQITSIQNLGGGQGYQLGFNGPTGYGYSVWTLTNAPLTSVQSQWTRLATGGVFSGGTDTYVDPNGGNSTSQFYILTVP